MRLNPPDSMRFWRLAFLFLLLLEIVSLWSVRHLPTQDGPSHLHNAAVLAGGAASYLHYYQTEWFQPAGNISTQILLAGLLRVFEPQNAEKVLVSGYVALFFLSFRYFLRGVSGAADIFSAFAGVAALNLFFYKGFWNFLYSVGLAFWLLGYVTRRAGPWRPAQLALLTAGGLALYLSHVVSWILCLTAVAVLGIPAAVDAFRSGANRRAAVMQYLAPLAALLPPAALLLFYLGQAVPAGASVAAAAAPGFRDRLYSLYNPDFLRSLVETDLTLGKAVAAAMALLTVTALWLGWKRGWVWREAARLLPLSAICGVIVMIGPDQQGTGSYIHARVVLYVWLFFVAWLAAAPRSWTGWPGHAVGVALFGLALYAMAGRVQLQREWEGRLAAVEEIGRHIQPGATVLQLNLHRSGPVDPYLHAVDILTAKQIVDLRNYEASTGTFPIRFRPERSPFPALGTAPQLEAVPPAFDIERYERETDGTVDYLLFIHGEPGAGARDRETALYAGQLAGYEFQTEADKGRLRLYQRRAGQGPATAVAGRPSTR